MEIKKRNIHREKQSFVIQYIPISNNLYDIRRNRSTMRSEMLFTLSISRHDMGGGPLQGGGDFIDGDLRNILSNVFLNQCAQA